MVVEPGSPLDPPLVPGPPVVGSSAVDEPEVADPVEEPPDDDDPAEALVGPSESTWKPVVPAGSRQATSVTTDSDASNGRR